MARLKRRDFGRSTLEVCRGILGQRIVRIEPDGTRLSGLITEAEAYIGQEDLGCHARSGLTERNRVMWGPAGHAYVYFTYGMHWMLNLVTEKPGTPAAVLIRGMKPIEGVERMQQRRSGRSHSELTDGPAKLCQALAIDGDWNGHDLCRADSQLFLESGFQIPDRLVTRGPRVGLTTVPEPWKSIPWRFRVKAEALRVLLEEEAFDEPA